MAGSGEGAGAVEQPAPLPLRLAAFFLDWAVGLGLAGVFALAAWLWLLLASANGNRQPADGALYGAIVIATAWLPLWAVYTLLSWTRHGQTPGLAAMELRVAERSGRPPGPGRALVRLAVLSIGAALLVLLPPLVVGLIAAAWQHTLPLLLALAGVTLALLAVIDPLWCVARADRRALHDVAAGTYVLRVR
jgi:uncharacterized RDD family membrane protein YckC